MNSRERMLTAFRRGIPDRVPVAPDVSNMIPARLTGKPFWDIYLHNDPPLWRAYVDCVRHFGFDGWFIYGGVRFEFPGDQRTWSHDTVSRSDDRIVVRTTCGTPDGELWAETTYYRGDPPTATRKWIKDLREDMPALRHFFPPIESYSPEPLEEQRAYLGEDGALGASVPLPGLHDLAERFDGHLEAATIAYYDQYDLLREFVGWQEQHILRQAEMVLDARPDFILIGASGLWTMQSPTIFRDLSLPTLKRLTRMAREADIPSFLHCCGKERDLTRTCAEETDLDVINPLEVPPMGDCDLAEIKRAHGDRLCLMGNLHTTEVMLRGTPQDVERECRRAIDDAAAGGGFVLSTGDQCGRDTPDENLRAMVRAAEEYGRY